MKIIRWLLSHTILILLIVSVIYGYMFWGNLLGEETPAGKAIAYLSEEFEDVAEFVDAVKAKQSKSSQHASTESLPAVTNTVETVSEPVAQPVVATKEEMAEVETITSNIEQQPVSISYSQNDMRVVQNSDGVINATRESATSEGEPQSVALATVALVSNAQDSKASESFVSVAVEKQLDNLDEQGKVIDASKNETLRESWIVARKSFYQRNYKLSEQSYLKVIDASKNNYDAYGELGNVYFNQGKNQQAASAYYEAAAILVRQGQVNRARSLIGLLRHLDKSKAIELKKLIDSPASKKMS